MDLSESVAMYVLGNISSEALPAIALDALESGYDSPALRQLAASQGENAEEIARLLHIALVELGMPLPAAPEAGLVLARRIADDILCERIAPYEGARRIWREVYTRFPQLEKLRTFVGLASEYEDDELHRTEYSRLIIDQSREFLGR